MQANNTDKRGGNAGGGQEKMEILVSTVIVHVFLHVVLTVLI